jgi:hypothetical protein
VSATFVVAGEHLAAGVLPVLPACERHQAGNNQRPAFIFWHSILSAATGFRLVGAMVQMLLDLDEAGL